MPAHVMLDPETKKSTREAENQLREVGWESRETTASRGPGQRVGKSASRSPLQTQAARQTTTT